MNSEPERRRRDYASAVSRRERYKQAGLCRCGGELDRNRKLCRKCLDQANKAMTGTYRRRMEAGLCIRCGLVPSVPGKDRCATHRAEQLARIKEFHICRLVNGKCCCGIPVAPGRGSCRTCLTANTTRKRHLRLSRRPMFTAVIKRKSGRPRRYFRWEARP